MSFTEKKTEFPFFEFPIFWYCRAIAASKKDLTKFNGGGGNRVGGGRIPTIHSQGAPSH